MIINRKALGPKGCAVQIALLLARLCSAVHLTTLGSHRLQVSHLPSLLIDCLFRLRREDGASVVRLRWYGPRSLKPDQKLYVEKKVHREPWTEENGFKV